MKILTEKIKTSSSEKLVNRIEAAERVCEIVEELKDAQSQPRILEIRARKKLFVAITEWRGLRGWDSKAFVK